MADKIYKKLPGVLQTSTIKNFFENTVEQLFSKANVELIQGYIGSPSSDDVGADGKFLQEPTATKRFYGLSPVVNTINVSTGDSENLIFYDELIDTLKIYGVDTKNHNKIFNEGYASLIPPVDVDKLLNYQEYYWYPQGPTTIEIAGTLLNPVDIDNDIIGVNEYTMSTGMKLRNGMVVKFVGDYVIPSTKTNREFVVAGVGDSIRLISKQNNYNTRFSTNESSAWIEDSYTLSTTTAKVSVDPTTSEYVFLGGTTNHVNANANTSITSPIDYIVQERGAINNNIWSRVNFWYHKDNFIDAGDALPNRQYRANRPIIEFDKNLEMYNHGTKNVGFATLAITNYSKAEINGIDANTLVDGQSLSNVTAIFPNEESTVSQYLYQLVDNAGTIEITRVGDPNINPSNTVDGDDLFKPFVFSENSTVQILTGEFNIGKEYVWKNLQWTIAQEKAKVNQPPLFNLYSTEGTYLGDDALYPQNNFMGSKLFGYAETAPTGQSATKATVEDTELGFPLVYKQFKAGSEILFENYQYTDSYNYVPFGSIESSDIKGYYYYKLLKSTPEYHAYFKTSSRPSNQRIVTTYNYSQVDFDRSEIKFWIGCIPNRDTAHNSGYVIDIAVNGVDRTDFTYVDDGYIQFDQANLAVGDFIEIKATSDTGLLKENSISKYEVPLSWDRNYFNEDVAYISEPEFLPQFRKMISLQDGFAGDSLGANNYGNSKKDSSFATDIVQTNHDILLGSFLLDDQPHNLVDALRFSGAEYNKYKNRLKSEISKYYEMLPTDGLNKEYILEQVLRNIVAYRIGREVFNTTYVVPFGDNYQEEIFTVPNIIRDEDREFTSTLYADLDKIENSLIVYNDGNLLTIDKDYSIVSYNPITVKLTDTTEFVSGSDLTIKLYNADRDSAQCPPTPSVLGLYPLFQPEITIDNSFETPVTVVIGHDGSKTIAVGDIRDELLLEFEKRIYNAAKAEFRSANSLPEYNILDVRNGAFRNTNYTFNEFHDLMRFYFNQWVQTNELDAVSNEFYDENNEWTWNYGDANTPGNWKGWYKFYYDTIRPHTHPWEMLGFTEQPSWWNDEYTYYAEEDIAQKYPLTDYTPANMHMWKDLEQGIIRRGLRENVSGNRYLTNNPYRRIGLHEVIPVDANGDRISPYRLNNTATTTIITEWNNTEGTPEDFRSNSFLRVNGVTVSYDSNNVYVQGNGIVNHELVGFDEHLSGHYTLRGEAFEQVPVSYNIPKIADLNNATENPTAMGKNAIAVLVNGLPLYSPDAGVAWKDTDYHYNVMEQPNGRTTGHNETENGLLHYHYIDPAILGLNDWDTATHSPIVGWAFDGLPIYGPYGYSDTDDTTSDIIKYRSSWELRSGTRLTGNSGPGGAHTGKFIEDYEFNPVLAGMAGYADKYNLVYSKTPDSPTQKIWHYKVTLNDELEPAFPYAVGGGTKTGPSGIYTWAGQFYEAAEGTGIIDRIDVTDKGGLYTSATVTITGDGTGATATAVIADDGTIESINITSTGSGYSYVYVDIAGDGVRAKAKAFISNSTNSSNNGDVAESVTTAFSSTKEITYKVIGNTENIWKFSDCGPVEYVWTSTEIYPFAVAEALLISKPGRFATIFSDPTHLTRHPVNRSQLYSKSTLKRWKFTDENEFAIHGDYDDSNNFITNIGYTQFIHSWLTFQGLNTQTDFAEKLRTLNMKLAHRMSGFIDKDTMVARTDQYSSTGNATSLIIPQENIDVALHSTNYKMRANYSGVIIEKTATGYRVKGFDKNTGYFTILESKKDGRKERVNVGGTPASYTTWQAGETYKKGTIVEHLSGYYEAPITLTQSTFDRSAWKRLPSLPQLNAARGTYYADTTGVEKRVHYNTEFTFDKATDTNAEEQVYDFLISLGRYQEAQGFDFGEFDTDIADVRNWAYGAKQFLYWTTGKWEIGNTIELSPLAKTVKFKAPTGFIAKINRSDREQFSIMDNTGAVIDPSECEIIRESDYISVTAPVTTQIYGIVLYTKELEHAVVLDNTTQFNDTIYNPILNQRQRRIKLKANRAGNWKGRFVTEGFIVDGSELIPNLDNLAESMGRYHEFGFIPVEKEVYQASRALFGYSEREYLRELDILDEQQYEFYKGMIQSKGTSASLDRISRSSSIVQGNVSIFDEWAVKLGDFGDTDSNQSIELKLEKVDFVQDPQLLTLGFPEDITNIVDKITIHEARQTYITTPTVEISAPTLPGTQATAVATLDPSTNKLSKITITNPGSGYVGNETTRIISSNINVSTNDYAFNTVIAESNTGYISFSNTMSVTLTDNLSANGAITITVTGASGNATAEEIETAINSNVMLGGNIVAKAQAAHYIDSSNIAQTGYTFLLSGKDFTVGTNDIEITQGTYQPSQRFAIQGLSPDSEDSLNKDDVFIKIDGTSVSVDNWNLNTGNVISVSPSQNYPQVDLSTIDVDNKDYFADYVAGSNVAITIPFNGSTISTSNLEKDANGKYKFVEVYLNGTRITNTVNDSTVNGTIFTLTENSITINSIEQLPRELLTEFMNPPMHVDLPDSGVQRKVYWALTANDVFKIVEKQTIEFQSSFKGDLPNKTINIKVVANEGITTQVRAARNYEITPDAKDDDVIFIDIDDASRFLKKPSGVREHKLWPTTANVSAQGLTGYDYPTILNSGYVNSANVSFKAYGLSSIPDLYDDQFIIKPKKNDYVHVAVSENNDWNVYKLQDIDSTISYVGKDQFGSTKLYTNRSLFEFLDTNFIGASNTGRYLDYFLALENAQTVDNVVVWTNENIVKREETKILNFEAPRMVEAQIKSIGPANKLAIAAVEPTIGSYIQGLTATPLTVSGGDVTSTVRITGPADRMQNLQNGDLIKLVDNVGNAVTNDIGISDFSAVNNNVTLSAGFVKSINVTNEGSGYQEPPNVTISGSSVGSFNTNVLNSDQIESANATAIAEIEGPVTGITLSQTGTYFSANIQVDATYEVSPATIEADIVGEVYAIDIVETGAGYSNISLPTVTISAPPVTSGNTTATATITEDDLTPAGEIIRIRITNPGTGYLASNPPTITISGGSPDTDAVGIASVAGTITATVVDGGFYSQYPSVIVFGSETNELASVSATAQLNGKLKNIQVVNRGFGYTSAPTVTIDAPASGVQATASAQFGTGTLALNSLVTNNGLSKVRVKLNANIPPEILGWVQAGIPNAQQEALYKDIKEITSIWHNPTTFDNTTGVFTIEHELLTEEVLRNLMDLSYTVIAVKDYSTGDVNNPYYEISNVTASSFTIDRANTLPSAGLTLQHYNKTKVRLVHDHSISESDIVRIFTPKFSGMYTVQSTPTANTFIIDSPFINGVESGNVVTQGIRIKTIEPHGISPMYAASDKRIALHFSDPLYYNKVYQITSVTPDTIYISGHWPLNDETHIYYDYATATMSADSPYDNSGSLEGISNGVKLRSMPRAKETIVTYKSNAEIVSPSFVNFDRANNILSISPDALPGDTNISTDFIIQRHIGRSNNRNPVVTTIDHAKVNLNGSDIHADNYNNPKALVNSINRAIKLRREHVTPKGTGLGLQFAFMKDYRTPVLGKRPASTIPNYGPYLRDETLISKLSSGQLQKTADIVYKTSDDDVLDSRFNKGPLKSGPVRGLQFTDENTGGEYVYRPDLRAYLPSKTPDSADFTEILLPAITEKQILKPEFHVDSVKPTSTPDWVASADLPDEYDDVVYGAGATVKYNNTNYTAAVPVTKENNITFSTTYTLGSDTIVQWVDVGPVDDPVNTILANNFILTMVPGSGKYVLSNNRPMQTLRYYDMTVNDTYTIDSASVTLPRYRLMPNRENTFLVYQLVQNDAGTLYYSLLDNTYPPLVEHDYYETVNSYSDFNSYPDSDYWYANELMPAVNENNQITNTNDPLKLRKTAKNVILPPVEPALYFGSQLIPEPFAVVGGNNSNPLSNLEGLPKISVVTDNGKTTVKCHKPGYNNFLLWTAGLTPGSYAPTQQGPGKLSGRNNAPTELGFGRGYYTANDNHDYTDYPILQMMRYDRPLPRFLYSKKFQVDPEFRNWAYTYYLDVFGNVVSEDRAGEDGITPVYYVPNDHVITDTTDENITNKNLRPEEIYVACFWTEEHTYKNQLTSFDISTLNETSGRTLPTPVYSDYKGTVTRVKYIRLSELPENAQTRRIIPDTGWGGKEWNNLRIDDINPNFASQTIDESAVWKMFEPNQFSSGSTGSNSEKVFNKGVGGPAGVTAPGLKSALADGAVTLNRDGTISREADTTIPTTDVGPILTGALLESLAGPCVPLPPPDNYPETGPTEPSGCSKNTKPLHKQVLIDNYSDEWVRFVPGLPVIDADSWDYKNDGPDAGSLDPSLQAVSDDITGTIVWAKSFKVYNSPNNYLTSKPGHVFRVLFNFLPGLKDGLSYGSVAIAQSDVPIPFAIGLPADVESLWGISVPTEVDTEGNSIANTQWYNGIGVDGLTYKERVKKLLSEYWGRPYTKLLRSTISNGGDQTDNGDQVGRYTVDKMSDIMSGEAISILSNPTGENLHSELIVGYDENGFDQYTVDGWNPLDVPWVVGAQGSTGRIQVDTDHVGMAPYAYTTDGSNSFDIANKTLNNTPDIAVRGLGFIERKVDCQEGQWITVFIRTDRNADPFAHWQCIIEYMSDDNAVTETTPNDDKEDECKNAPSRAYANGAVIKTWKGTNNYGYFGTSNTSDGERPYFPANKGSNYQFHFDNIYFPYQGIPTYGPTGWSSGEGATANPGGVNAYNASAYTNTNYTRNHDTPTQKTANSYNVSYQGQLVTAYFGSISRSSGGLPQYTTKELKGYFKAPVTGLYRVVGNCDDGVWTWISSAPPVDDDDFATNYTDNVAGASIGWAKNALITQVRFGRDDLSGDEYFTEDGYKGGMYGHSGIDIEQDDEYARSKNYHRANYIFRTGWITTNSESNHDYEGWNQLASIPRYVWLEKDKYYFTRMIFGNNKGPGHIYTRLEYWNKDTNTYGVWNWTFSGRNCALDDTLADTTGTGGTRTQRPPATDGQIAENIGEGTNYDEPADLWVNPDDNANKLGTNTQDGYNPGYGYVDPNTGNYTVGDNTPVSTSNNIPPNPFNWLFYEEWRAFYLCSGRNTANYASTTWTPMDWQCLNNIGKCPPGYSAIAGTGCQISMSADTPIVNPAPGSGAGDGWSNYQNQNNDFGAFDWRSTYNQAMEEGKYYTWTGTGYINSIGNSVVPGRAPMSGYNFMPSTFKASTKKQVVNVNRYGFTDDILPTRYVSATHQRVSGGFVIPLAKKLTLRSRKPVPLRSESIVDQPWGKNVQNLQNLNKTTRYVDYDPIKVGNTIYINGKKVSNVAKNKLPATASTLASTTPAVPANTTGGLFSGQQILKGVSDGGFNSNPASTPFIGDEPTSVLSSQSLVSPISGVDTVRLDPPAFDQPAISTGINSGSVSGMADSGVVSDDFVEIAMPENLAPFDNDNIRFTKEAIIDVTPQEYNAQGKLVPAGPTARAVIRKPTPTVRVPAEKFYGIPKGSELVINGRKIKIRGTGAIDIATQVNCQSMGIKATTSQGAGEEPDLVLSSCNDSGFTIANGCGGGAYKEVGDFHINRGFEQQRNLSNTSSYAANAMFIPHTVNAEFNEKWNTTANKHGQLKSQSEVQKYIPVETLVYNEKGKLVERLDKDGDPFNPPDYTWQFGVEPGDRYNERKKNVFLPIITNTRTENVVYSVGGSGYRIGDRLRLIGGTPVTNVKAPVTYICIDSAGAGFTNPANIQIVFNETPSGPKVTGVGARAVVEELDNNGGIAKIKLLNGGAGYDVNNPPAITVHDRSPTQYVNIQNINAQYPESVSIAGDQVFTVTDSVPVVTADNYITDNIEVDRKYFRATAPFSFGESSDTTLDASKLTVATQITSGDIATTVNNDLFQINISGSTVPVSWLKLNTYIEIEYTSQDSGQPVTVAGLIPPAQWSIATGTPTINSNRFFIQCAGLNADDLSTQVQGTFVLRVKKPWHLCLVGSNESRPVAVEVPNITIGKVQPKLRAMIGMVPNPDDNTFEPAEGYSGLAGPLRVAKFIVTGVDSLGAITNLKVIDRGLYEIFPSDLTYGIPLEYDHEPSGALVTPGANDERVITEDQRKHMIGIGDPFRNNILYGPGHPEYDIQPFTEKLIEVDKTIRGVLPEPIRSKGFSFPSTSVANYVSLSLDPMENLYYIDDSNELYANIRTDWFPHNHMSNGQLNAGDIPYIVYDCPLSGSTGTAFQQVWNITPRGSDPAALIGVLASNPPTPGTGADWTIVVSTESPANGFGFTLGGPIPSSTGFRLIIDSSGIKTDQARYYNEFVSMKPGERYYIYMIPGSFTPGTFNFNWDSSKVLEGYLLEATHVIGSAHNPDPWYPEDAAELASNTNTSSRGTYFTDKKHPDWVRYPEFYWNGKEYQFYYGTPGAYDPNVWVIVDFEDYPASQYANNPNALALAAQADGKLLRKEYVIDLVNSQDSETFGRYVTPLKVPGGTGAKVFLTSRDVPACTERGQAKESLGLPDFVDELNVPETLAQTLNDAFTGSGYRPDDAVWRPELINDIGVIKLDTTYPGVNIDSPTPGVLEKLGIPIGDYNVAQLCIEAELEQSYDPVTNTMSPNISEEEFQQQLLDSGAFGVTTGSDPNSQLQDDNYAVITLACVTTVGGVPWDRETNETSAENDPGGEPWDPPGSTGGGGGGGADSNPGESDSNWNPPRPFDGRGVPNNPPGNKRTQLGNTFKPPVQFPLNDNNSLFGPGKSYTMYELYEYDITDIYGNSVNLPVFKNREDVSISIFESKRINANNRMATDTIALEPKVWVDNYQGAGWAYLEYGNIKAQQEPLVDVNKINNAIIYDPETGNDIKDLYKWDPFKGVLPAIVSNELDYISEADPVSYNSARSMFGQSMIGKVWWDTSTVRYEWYEQGTNKERWENWGKAFPGSSITVCEWVESEALPKNWIGNGVPRWNDKYITERRQDPTTGEYKLYYYYWVQNRNVVDTRVTRNTGRTISVETLAKYISNPIGYGLKLLNFVSDESITLTNVVVDMKEEENLQINFSRNTTPQSINHKAWKLIRENDNNSRIPDHISDKLIDSLSGYNAIGQVVPDPKLSEIEKYGIKFRPRQTMFKDIKEARRVMVNTLNTMLADWKLNTQYAGWDKDLPAQRRYIQTVNWYAVNRIDPVTNEKIRYDQSYKPVYNVKSVSELYRLKDIPDGTVVQVKNKQNDALQLWLYKASTQDFVQISSANDTVKLTSAVYTDDTNETMATELRSLLIALRKLTVDELNWNQFFFSMLKYAYLEQLQLDWAFKTSYLFVEKEENDLVQFTGFKPDNTQRVIDYMNEVKPYSAKIREYKDGKKTPIEYIGRNNISDYDKPPYVDTVTGEIRILDDFSQDDTNIMVATPAYQDYVSISNKTEDPIRKGNTTLVFDRTYWQLTEPGWIKNTTPTNVSIANNIAMLTQLTKLEVSQKVDVLYTENDTLPSGTNPYTGKVYAVGDVKEWGTRAIDRIFKFDEAVQAMFVAEINTYFNDITASSNANIVGNASMLTSMIDAGGLNRTLALLKDKVGGNFNGETLDGKLFSTVLGDTDYMAAIINEFGFDTEPFDQNTTNDNVTVTDETYGNVTSIGTGDHAWDSTTQLVSYEGVFDVLKQGSVTLRRDGDLYEGFDGVTFHRILYGEERPEELALIDPLESLILTVTTSPYANGNVQHQKISSSAKEVTYRSHLSLFGNTDYLRVLPRTSTTLKANLEIYDSSIEVVSAQFMPSVTTLTPGKIWIGTELIMYGKRNGNVLSQLTRGVNGTTIEQHVTGTPVYSAEDVDHFNNLNPQGNIWLDLGTKYANPETWDEAVDNTPGNINDADYTFLGAWDEIANSNLTISNAYAIVSNVTNTTADLTLSSALSVVVDEGIKVTNTANASITDVVRVSAVNGNVVSISSSFAYGPAGNLDVANLFVNAANVQLSAFNYGDQTNADSWDAAAILAGPAQSLADRANANFLAQSSIMRFLHEL